MISCSLGLRVTQKLKLSTTIRQVIGETSGEIPLYSLHRIKNMLRKQPIQVSQEFQAILLENLVFANTVYKEESGNDWNCLTSSNLVDAIEGVDTEIKEGIESINDIPKELAVMRGKLLTKLHEKREKDVVVIEKWFENNFDSLLYDMSKNIPWAIVCRLRRDLGYWIATKVNPFGKDIEEMVLEVASESGIKSDDPEEAWEKMGGKIFKKKVADD